MKRIRRSYSGVEIERYLIEFSDFAGSKARFCREKELSINTFSNWQKIYKKGVDHSLKNSFVEVELPPDLPEFATIKYGEFTLSNFENIAPNKLLQILTSFVEASRVCSSSK